MSEQHETHYVHVFSNPLHTFPHLILWSLQQRQYLFNKYLTPLAVLGI